MRIARVLWFISTITYSPIAIALIALAAASPRVCSGQSLALTSGTALANGSVSLNLNLTSPTGSEPVALQWTLTYPAANVVSISEAPGLSANNAGKTLNCAATGTG